jgi:hypothetical protein
MCEDKKVVLPKDETSSCWAFKQVGEAKEAKQAATQGTVPLMKIAPNEMQQHPCLETHELRI